MSDLISDTPSPVALLAEGVDRNLLEIIREYAAKVALLAEGVDRNFKDRYPITLVITSPSSRRAWIEICEEIEKGSIQQSRPPRGGRG